MQGEMKLAIVIRVEVVERKTQYTAKSPDLPGLFVSAHDVGGLLAGLPRWIEKHFAAQGERVIAVRAHSETPGYAAYVAVPAGVAEEALRRVAELV